MLVVTRMHSFRDGLVFLYENMRLFREVGHSAGAGLSAIALNYRALVALWTILLVPGLPLLKGSRRCICN